MKNKDSSKVESTQNIKEVPTDNTKEVVVESIKAESTSINEPEMPKYFFDDFIKAIRFANYNRIEEIVNQKEMLRDLCHKHAEEDWNIFHFCASSSSKKASSKIFQLLNKNLDNGIVKELLAEKNEEGMTPYEIAYCHRKYDLCEEIKQLGLNLIGNDEIDN